MGRDKGVSRGVSREGPYQETDDDTGEYSQVDTEENSGVDTEEGLKDDADRIQGRASVIGTGEDLQEDRGTAVGEDIREGRENITRVDLSSGTSRKQESIQRRILSRLHGICYRVGYMKFYRGGYRKGCRLRKQGRIQERK
jgi:hypothetical protein